MDSYSIIPAMDGEPLSGDSGGPCSTGISGDFVCGLGAGRGLMNVGDIPSGRGVLEQDRIEGEVRGR